MKIGPHEVQGELGRGGMGVVFRVRSPDGSEAALKLLTVCDPATLARFERERRLLASLGVEQGFVGLLDSGTSPEGAWLLMPLVPGGTLRQRLEAGPLGVEETVALGRKLATALGAAHERGIVHRDVKPENVLFTRDGRPLLADLGLAKHFDRGAIGASQSKSLSAHGAFKGTVGYMAPEQTGDAGSVGPPADVYALGAVLYECLAGHPAFVAESVVEILARMSSGAVEPIGRAGVSPWLEGAVLRALARDPLERFADGASLARALRSLETPWKKRRSPLVPLLLGASVCGVLVALVASMPSARPAPPPTPPPRPPASQEPVLSARQLLALAVEKGRRNDDDGALAALTKAIELDPALSPAWGERGLVRYRRCDWDGAIADLTKAIELDPGFAQAWQVRGRARLEKHDREGVIADETKAIELDPKLPNAWFVRGEARRQKGDWDGVIADETKAIELDPGLSGAWMIRGWAFAEKGDWDRSISEETKAIDLDSKLALAWANRGWARLAGRDWDRVIADETKAIALDPEEANAWQYRGIARAQKGDVEGGIADETRAIELEPRNPTAWANRGLARDLASDWEGAIADETKAIELDPKIPPYWRNRGAARNRNGDREGAIEDAERFLELAPGDPEAPTVRQWIEQEKARRP